MRYIYSSIKSNPLSRKKKDSQISSPTFSIHKSRIPIWGENMSSAGEVLLSLFLLLFLSFAEKANGLPVENSTLVEMVPLIEPGKAEMVVMLNDSRRRLGSFQICALCTCCGGAKNYCLPSPCCYAINCNIPNRPFGFCSFTPKTCNCFGCHL